MEVHEFIELIPGLPEELGLECLSRLTYTSHRIPAAVCSRWRQLLKSKWFYEHRRKNGYTHTLACLVQAVNDVVLRDGGDDDDKKPCNSPSYAITVFDSVSQTWSRLDPVPLYPNGLPLFCGIASCEGKLLIMGGWEPVSYDPVSHVFIYDFMTQRWSRGKDMPSKRSFFAMGAYGGRVYLAGGHDENKNALKTAWVYQPIQDEWTELAPMNQERDECEGLVIGEEFWVVSGYSTDRQGQFMGNAEVYDFDSGNWRQLDGVWEEGRCPRSRAGVDKDGKLINWAKLASTVQVGPCGVDLGSGVLVIGSEHQGAAQGFYMVRDKQKRNLERIGVSLEFSGFVQSGCFVEI